MIARITAVAAAALALSGCALLSSPDPVQTYRFGTASQPVATTGAAPAPLTVSLRSIEFPDASKDDRILGVTGTETAYIGGARWISRAEKLFDDSLRGAFAARADQVRLLNRREPGTAPMVLQVVVTSFEARYAQKGVAPDIVISAQVQLRSRGERGPGGVLRPEAARSVERTFTVSQPARENRISAIVEAFDVGTRDLNTQIVAWTIEQQQGG